MKGYLHPNYAKSFINIGEPLKLKKSDGWIIKRPISSSKYYDAMGCYPLFLCRNWSKLFKDLEDLDKDLITLSLVTDPFGDYTENYLKTCFKDIIIPFKEHFVIDLHKSMKSFVCDNHRRNARKGLKLLRIEKCANAMHYIDQWIDLYANLVKRHNIEGIQAFSRISFQKQLSVPGLVIFRAIYEGKSVGMSLWYEQDEVAYYHLGAYSNLGYELRASFALFWTVIEYFAENNLRWINLGGGAGLKNTGEDGLTRFKKGWSTESRIVFFCGRIINKFGYEELIKAKNNATSNYFPPYRC